MNAAGFEYTTRNDAIARAGELRRASGDMTTPTTEELTIASYDVQCSKQHGDPDQRFDQTVSAAESYVLREHEGLLLSWLELQPTLRQALVNSQATGVEEIIE